MCIRDRDHTTTRVKVADNITEVFVRNDNCNLHDRLKENRISFSHSLFECCLLYTSPAPPSAIAVPTPIILPVPIVEASAVVSA